jgi:hypothetical protein
MKILIKPILYILIFTSLLFCDTVSFKEGKYVEALDIFTYRDGNVSYSDEQTIIKYQDGKTITKKDNNLTVQNSNGELLTTIDLGKRVEISLYFKLTKALFLKDFKSLEENFEIKALSDRNYLFMPKDNIKNVIEEIRLTLNQDETPKEFSINFGNGDIIKIETK